MFSPSIYKGHEQIRPPPKITFHVQFAHPYPLSPQVMTGQTGGVASATRANCDVSRGGSSRDAKLDQAPQIRWRVNGLPDNPSGGMDTTTRVCRT
ncbi:hypothetical protein CDAR_192071 [Caerostris darwini]|uniref:Uncharacterized protein n=1 Tax=Caerostris darwini TaxID=1538125 RepID=A0AAV4PGG3_9ARAC|nr:hypothetical protein CDAR_192071 [Caerostris darwini]